MAFDLLTALRPRQWRSTICVRVCRKWEYRGGTDDGPIQHVDMVLVDEKGNSIYAEIPEQEVETKSPLLEEDGIYVINRFRVSNAKSAYRPVDSPYMVEFTLHTTVSAARTDLPGFPQYAYKITPVDALPARAGDTRNFVDTIGILVESSEAYTVRLPNKAAPTLTRHIVLRDLSYAEIKITLWGHRAAAFNTDGIYNHDTAAPIIVLFVGGLMKTYQGNYYLSANAASRWYFNPAIPEARQFHDSLQGQRLEIRFLPAPREANGQPQLPAQRMLKTLQELNNMDPYDFPDEGYNCTVTVGRLVPNASWWFPSCSKCSKSCAPDGAGYRCNTCSSTSFKFKYKISFVAVDGQDEAEMICFGEVARRIVGKTVQQLLRASTSANTYPPEITRIVSLRFTFAVALTQQSFYREQKTYQVISVVTSAPRQPPAPALSNNTGGTSPGTSASQSTSQQMEPSDATLSIPCLLNTPPPAADLTDPPSVKSQLCKSTEKSQSSSAKKRLAFQDEVSDMPGAASTPETEKTVPETVTESALDSTDLTPEKKKARGNKSKLHQSG